MEVETLPSVGMMIALTQIATAQNPTMAQDLTRWIQTCHCPSLCCLEFTGLQVALVP